MWSTIGMNQILYVVLIPECPLKPGITLNHSQKPLMANRERIVKIGKKKVFSFLPFLGSVSVEVTKPSKSVPGQKFFMLGYPCKIPEFLEVGTEKSWWFRHSQHISWNNAIKEQDETLCVFPRLHQTCFFYLTLVPGQLLGDTDIPNT